MNTPWPANLISFKSGNPEPPYFLSDYQNLSIWRTNDPSPQPVTYGGVFLQWDDLSWDPIYADLYGQYIYYAHDSQLTSMHPTSTVPSDNDVALVGAVSMQSGSKVQLGAGATWARNVTVTA